MTVAEVAEAVEAGKKVFWKSSLYAVQRWRFRDGSDQGLYVVCLSNSYATGLQEADAKDCYIQEMVK